MAEDLAKMFFGQTLKVARAKSVCVSCRSAATKATFKTPEGYESYKEDGLCQGCQDELASIPKRKRSIMPLYSEPRYPLVEEVQPV